MLPTSGAPVQCAVTFLCPGAQGVTQESHRTRGFANRTRWPDWAHTGECLMNQAVQDEESCEKGHKHSCINIQHKACSPFRHFFSWEPAACPSVPSETPDGAYSQAKSRGTLHWLHCVCALEPQSNSSEGMSGWWHFFPRLFLAPAPGEQERSYGWICTDAAGKIPVSIGHTMLGQWAVMWKFPAELWRRSPCKSLEPPIWKEILRKWWINTILFGSGQMGFVGWMHRNPPGFCNLLWTTFPAQEHLGEAGLGLRTSVKD